MNQIFLSIVFIFLSLNSQSQIVFQGEVHFVTTMELENEVLKNIISNYPVESKMTIGKDKFRIDNLNQKPNMIEYQIFDLINGLLYESVLGNDTIYKRSIDTIIPKLIIAEPADQTEMVLGKDCKSFIIKTETNYPQLKNQIEQTVTIFYNEEFKINGKKYSKYKLGYMNIFYSQSNAIYLKLELESNQGIKSIQQATKIIPRDVEENEFMYDLNRPIKLVKIKH